MKTAQDIINSLPDDWRGYFVERAPDGAIKGVYRCPQIGYAEEPLAEADAEVVAFLNRTKEPIADPLRAELDTLKARLDTVEAALKTTRRI